MFSQLILHNIGKLIGRQRIAIAIFIFQLKALSFFWNIRNTGKGSISVCTADVVERDAELRFFDIEGRVDVVTEVVRVEGVAFAARGYLL